MSVFEQLKESQVKGIIKNFYDKAFNDSIIGHLFWGHEKDELIKKQISFALTMLGLNKKYQGKPLKLVHGSLKINKAHFGRRQVLMEETLREYSVSESIVKSWLELEAALKPVIVSCGKSCRSVH